MASTLALNTLDCTAREQVVTADSTNTYEVIELTAYCATAAAGDGDLLIQVVPLHGSGTTATADYVRVRAGQSRTFTIRAQSIPDIYVRSFDGSTTCTYDLHLSAAANAPPY